MRSRLRCRANNADITIGCLPIDEGRASDFGLMKIDAKGQIKEFAEKPKGDALKAMAVGSRLPPRSFSLQFVQAAQKWGLDS